MGTQGSVLKSSPGALQFTGAWQEVAAALVHPLQVLRYGKQRWQERALARAFREAQLALGERMYAAGIDDGQTGALLNALDERLRGAEARAGGRSLLDGEREKLLVRLAAAALAEEAPLPGAEHEYAEARSAQAALAANGEHTDSRKDSSTSWGRAGWGRRAAGYALLGGSLVLGSLAAFGWLR